MGLGDVHWHQIWLLLNNHTSLGRLGPAALVGSQSRRGTTLIRNLRVPGVLDRLDSTCEDLGLLDMSDHPESVPQPWVNCPRASEGGS